MVHGFSICFPAKNFYSLIKLTLHSSHRILLGIGFFFHSALTMIAAQLKFIIL